MILCIMKLRRECLTRVFYGSGKEEGFFILLETVRCFQVQSPQIKVCHWILCIKERVSFSLFNI